MCSAARIGLGCTLCALWLLTGCEQAKTALRAQVCEPDAKKAKTKPDGGDEEGHGGDGGVPSELAPGHGEGEGATEPEALEPEPERDAYALPFAWESSGEEPLARTRAFLREVGADNASNVARGSKAFTPFASSQTPRATVVTCSDSRVQTTAYDRTPENDDFMIRNIGNQVALAEGSIEYGIEHLHTPLLLIMGHTGCGAVKAAMGDTRKLGAAIQRELAPLKVSRLQAAKAEDGEEHEHGDDAHHEEQDAKRPAAAPEPTSAQWAQAVQENVHNQVQAALEHFGRDVHAGELTIVGAVYDFRNDLKQGYGKLEIINVNGVRDAARLRAFQAAIRDSKSEPAADAMQTQLTEIAARLAAANQPTAHAH